MQPNQSYSPAPNQDPNNEPPIDPLATPTTYQNSQPVVAEQPTPPSQYAQPQPVQKSQFELDYEAALREPAPKKSHKGLMIGGIIATILVLAAGGSAYAWMQYTNSPQQRLYRALENHMTTSYIQQNYKQDITLAGTADLSMQSTTDFSDPKAPKSYIEYTQRTNEKDESDLSGKLIGLNDKEYYANLTKTLNFSGQDSDLAPVTNQWYRVDTDESIGGIIFDPLGALTAVNTSKGEVLVGNFNKDVRQDLMTFIKEHNIYIIKSSEEVAVDGEKMTKYELAINLDRVNELNDKATKALGLPKGTKVNDVKQKDGQTNHLWVSHKSNRIVKAELTRKSLGTKSDGSKATDVSTIDISYPSDVSKIAKPDTAIAVPWN